MFPYSPRPGTSAIHFAEQVEATTKAQRAKELREIAATDAMRFKNSIIGNVRSVLWEGSRGESGMTDNYVKVRMGHGEIRENGDGLIERVELLEVDADGTVLVGPAEAVGRIRQSG